MNGIENYERQKKILRELAEKVAEISALPVQEENKKAWIALNGLKPIRPMFMIDQLPWGQLNYENELDLQCQDGLLRHYEWILRETLYRFRHMPDDRVVSLDFRVPKAIRSTGYGVGIEEDVIAGDAGTAANSHRYKNVLKTDEDIEKIQFPKISEDKQSSLNILNMSKDIFGGILNVIQGGVDTYGHVWDVISTLHGVEDCMIDLADRPEFMHKIAGRFFEAFHFGMTQYEELGLIDAGQPAIHCTGAFTDELPGFKGESNEELEQYRHSAKNVWTYGAAQLFSMVSPAMHDEFEIEYQKKWYSRFGLGYYGCCEPLDRKINIISKIPNVRKISMSPWTDMELGSECMNGRYVLSRKPNPAFLASDIAWQPELVKKDLENACKIAEKHGNPCELILKDVSTVGNNPQRLWEWAKIASEVCGKN